MNARIITIIIPLLLGVSAILYFSALDKTTDDDVTETDVREELMVDNQATTTEDIEIATSTNTVAFETETTIGTSVAGNDIVAHHYGTGTKEVLFVGGIHGGYSWNTVLVARELMNHLSSNTSVVPENMRVTVIPVLNPDGLEKVVGTTGEFSVSDIPSSLEQTVPGRFNANTVDLNRNFNCDWSSEATWQRRTVSGGSSAFSEPESKAIRQYVRENNLEAVIVWYSSVGGVFASNCHDGILPETLTLTNLFSDASGYKAYEDFNFYAITGDMVNWLSSEGIPAISVLLTTHEDVEWDKNKRGVEAILNHYGE